MASESEVFEAALSLPEAERARLAHELLLSLDSGADEGAEQLWLDEVQRRLTEFESGTAVAEEWSVVRDGLSAKLRNLKR